MPTIDEYPLDRITPVPRFVVLTEEGFKWHSSGPNDNISGVLAVNGRHWSSDAWLSTGYCSFQTPYGQGVGIGVEERFTRAATWEEIERALSMDHPHGPDFRPSCPEATDASFALTLAEADHVREGTFAGKTLGGWRTQRDSAMQRHRELLARWSFVADAQRAALYAAYSKSYELDAAGRVQRAAGQLYDWMAASIYKLRPPLAPRYQSSSLNYHDPDLEMPIEILRVFEADPETPFLPDVPPRVLRMHLWARRKYASGQAPDPQPSSVPVEALCFRYGRGADVADNLIRELPDSALAGVDASTAVSAHPEQPTYLQVRYGPTLVTIADPALVNALATCTDTSRAIARLVLVATMLLDLEIQPGDKVPSMSLPL
jgi:hypothetical protein